MKSALLIALSLAASIARADDSDSLSDFDHHVDAPTNAVELGLATGYAQGFGPLGGGIRQHVEDVSRAGGALEIDATYRINPRFAVGMYGALSQFATGSQIDSQTDVYGATLGVQGTVHVRPERSIDPWLSVGVGWRGLWLAPEPSGKDTSLQGFELVRLQIGADYRVNEDIAIAPVIGASLNVYVGEESPMTTKLSEIDDKQLNFVAFAGLAGRFDFNDAR